jgi:collagenase-like PrtC family protease
MCLANHIPEITKSGVTSLKIEGRMKSPEYVGTVTSIYRRLLDENRIATGKEIELLANVFSRSGFTDGYFVSKITPDMFGVRSETDKQKSNKTSFNIPKAEKRKDKEIRSEAKPFVLPERDESKVLHPAKQKGIVLRFEGRLPSDELLSKYAENVARIDVPLDKCCDKRFSPYKEKISAVLPRTIFLKERDKIKKQLETAKAYGIKQATVSALNQIDLCEGFYLHGDYAFNIVNRETIAFLERYPFSSLMISPETDGRFPKGSKCALEYIGYGRTPLMYTRTCIIRNISDCKHKEKCFATLTDRTGASFPIISSANHTNIIYNSLPAYRLDKKSELKKCGVGLITLMFTDETVSRMDEIISLALENKKPDFQYTRR